MCRFRRHSEVKTDLPCGGRGGRKVACSVRRVAIWLVLMAVATVAIGSGRTGPGAIADMNHRSWSVASGAPADIWDMHQDALGFVWLATGSGLVRFDGLRFQRYMPAEGEAFASNDMTALFVVSPTELWVGTTTGVVSHVKDGHITNHYIAASANNAMVLCFAQTQDGALWVITDQRIVRFMGDKSEVIGSSWGEGFDHHASWMVVDEHGTAWLATDGDLMFLRKGGHRFESSGVPLGWYAALGLSPDGTLWASDATYGTRAMPGLSADVIPTALKAPSRVTGAVPVTRIAFDRDGGLWGTVTRAGRNNGVFHVAKSDMPAPGGALGSDAGDWYRAADGLNSVNAVPLLIDQEGDVWVGTNFGLHRFHTNSFRTMTIAGHEANMMWLSQGPGGALGVLQDGCFYTLTHANPILRTCAFPPASQYEIFLKGDSAYTYTYRGLFHWEFSGETWEQPFPAGLNRGNIRATATDAQGIVWIAATTGERSSVYRQVGRSWEAGTLTPGQSGADITIIAFDWLNRAWTGTASGQVMVWNGEALTHYGRAQGLSVGAIEAISARPSGTLVAGDTGVARLLHGRFDSLSMSRLGLPGPVTGALQSRQGDLWLNTTRGIVRIDRAAAEAAFNDTSYSPPYSLYGSDDGVSGIALMHPTASTIFEDVDGRLWFANNQGVSWVDPQELKENAIAPQAIIESVAANGVAYPAEESLTLKSPTQTVAFQFTAASFLSPENVKFKYRLSSVDTAWQKPTTDRQATFVNLGPGHYRFEVLAANSNGVWGRVPASINFTIEPLFYQMRRFQVLGALTVFACLLVLSASQYRNAVGRIRDRLEAQHAERGRIARHLHDTLIQGIQALILQFHAISDQISNNAPLHEAARRAINRADAVMEEARDQVQDMRTREHVATDIVRAFADVGHDLSNTWPATFRLTVTGDKRPLNIAVSEEIFLIGREALINAFTHGSASLVELGVVYGSSEFSISCIDNGKGIELEVLNAGRRDGHWGLPGMRERSDSISGELDICAAASTGTQVTLIVPARIAYEAGEKFWWHALMSLLTFGRDWRSLRRG